MPLGKQTWLTFHGAGAAFHGSGHHFRGKLPSTEPPRELLHLEGIPSLSKAKTSMPRQELFDDLEALNVPLPEARGASHACLLDLEAMKNSFFSFF